MVPAQPGRRNRPDWGRTASNAYRLPVSCSLGSRLNPDATHGQCASRPAPTGQIRCVQQGIARRRVTLPRQRPISPSMSEYGCTAQAQACDFAQIVQSDVQAGRRMTGPFHTDLGAGPPRPCSKEGFE